MLVPLSRSTHHAVCTPHTSRARARARDRDRDRARALDLIDSFRCLGLWWPRYDTAKYVFYLVQQHIEHQDPQDKALQPGQPSAAETYSNMAALLHR